MALPERKREIKAVKSKLVSNSRSRSKAESVKTDRRFKRKHHKKERRGRKVSRRNLNPGSPIPYRKPNPAFFQPVEKRLQSRLLQPLFTERAQLALAEYNKKNNLQQGAEFELVRVVGGLQEGGCHKFFPWFFHDKPYGWVHHIFFKAKNYTDHDDKTFFAELFIGMDPEDVVNFCCIVEPDDPAGGTKLGCGFCAADERHPHPQSGFAAGLVPFVPYNTLVNR